uniref:Uncharacterized protein n=1 Tax=Conchiformibius kuhniae TaxID=211502 RepID=A0A8T9MUD8_9NEIS|nr:hypothetical protein LVJ77_04935 [Conchiformibius kuhniae]
MDEQRAFRRPAQTLHRRRAAVHRGAHRYSSQNAGALDTYKFVTVDWNTGQKRSSVHFSFGLLSDPLQTAGNFGFDRSYWQGTMNGIIRVKP